MTHLDPRIMAFAQEWVEGNRRGLQIEGFGPDDPPAPSSSPQEFAQVLPGSTLAGEEEEDLDAALPTPPPSPLIELGKRAMAPPPAPAVIADEMGTQIPVSPEILVVVGRQAAFRGQAVELTEQDEAAIARIVLEAAQRRLRAQLDAVKIQAPRRRKKEVQVEAPKRRRGRPPKEKGDARE